MPSKSQHVVPGKDGWRVVRSGALRASSVHATQKDAVATARTIARREKSELYIHGSDGRIRERKTYGDDPFPPKG